MELASLYHRPESEYAYLYTKDTMHIRFRAKKDDVKDIVIFYGDPYLMSETIDALQNKSMRKIASTKLYDYFQVSVCAPHRRLAYLFVVTSLNDTRYIYSDKGVNIYSDKGLQTISHYFRLPYFHEKDMVKTPQWVKETVWYQIFPERFANGNPDLSPQNVLSWDSKEHPSRTDFFGGDLQGVLDNLDYLEELGVNGLYFCPIFEASTNHKYDTIDYMQIDRHFGDKSLFKTLVDTAHQKGMKIMLDAVFNHLGHHSKQWQDVLTHQEHSKYKDWFHILRFPVGQTEIVDIENTKNLEYDTFSFSANMPKLNTANEEVQKYLLDIATYWIREFHIDAWRLDVANEVDHHFWKKFYEEAVALNENFYILGEIWHSAQAWLNGDEFHAVMNYAFTDSIKEGILTKKITPEEMISQLQEQMMMYRQQTNEVMFNLLDSHDTPRVLTVAKGDKKRVMCALAFMFMQFGTPCLYYGTEVGMTGEGDPDCRKPMWWDTAKQDKKMLNFTKQLIHFRKSYADVLGTGDVQFTCQQHLVTITRTCGKRMLKGYFNLSENQIALECTSVFSTQEKKGILSPNECTIEYTVF
ncbi:alpha-glycosidase [Granulicatella sp. zg-ZJ]|uniref:glycoside hydrolase family 13 protein n=1 Tax=Granulicatella sp. zg-ZJ TaxID=2678504 RepID=UPI0013D25F9B|nr:glycoside hydrolase family 13 protein [Granulicatella sp. zg-ZJ]NEW62926.1 alpha-glycosidase [Granulicatella sp. zg-ZJ]